MEVENSTARYSEHIKALFASPKGVNWTHAGRVVRVFATYNQRSSYAKEVDTNHRYTMLTPVLLYRMDLIVLRQSPREVSKPASSQQRFVENSSSRASSSTRSTSWSVRGRIGRCARSRCSPARV